ncbi:MAG: metallophosphoesterase [Myxococcota bacterium]
MNADTAPTDTRPSLPLRPSRTERRAAGGDSIDRRSFLQRTVFGVPLLIGGTTSLYGALVGRHDYAIEEVPVPLAGLSRRLDGYAIVQLSDIHFGTFVDDRELDSAVELVRRAQPDLVVLTGDLVDHDPRYADHLGRLVRRLRPLARDGVTAIAGNHDYYAGIDAVLTMLRRSGARVLVNQGHTLGDAGGAFALLGVDDIWSARNGVGEGPDLGRALSMVPGDLPRVLLCHNPAFFPEAAGEVQLQLSGHTHGGQVNVGVQLAHLVLPYGYVAGRYRRGDSLLYVNRGFGTAGPPARIGAAPEVTRVVLTAG